MGQNVVFTDANDYFTAGRIMSDSTETSDNRESRPRMALHWQILGAMILGTVIGVAVNPGDVHVSAKITAHVTQDGDRVKLTETTAAGD